MKKSTQLPKQQISLKHNMVMNTLLAMSSFIFPLISFPYISRILLPVGTGKVSFASSIISYFSIFAQLGIPTYGIRICAAVRDDKEKLTRIAHELLFINLIMCAISYAVLTAALVTVPKLREEWTLYVIISATLFLSAIGMEWFYKALEQYTYITVRSVTFKAVSVAAMFLLIHKQEDYVIYGGITVFASSASNLLNLFHVHKYIGLKPVGNYNLKRHLRPVLVFFAMSCAVTIYTHMDTVMLGFMAGDADVGYYNAAVKIKGILVSVVTSLGAVLLPRTSYYAEHKMWSEFEAVTKKALNFVFWVAVPLMAYFTLYAREGIFLLSGLAYANSILPMRIIMPTLLLIGITNVLGMQILVPLGREKVVLCSEITGALVNLIINALLIPRFSSTGAAIGTVAAEFTVLTVQYASLRNDISGVFHTDSFWKVVIATVFGAVGSYWIVFMCLGNFLTLVITACLFGGIYGAFLMATKEDLTVEIWRQTVKKLKRG